MKFTKIFAIALVGIILSCSTDSSTESGSPAQNSTARLTNSQITSLQTQLATIKTTTLYGLMRSSAQAFALGMKYNKVNFQDRNGFIAWINVNVSATNFTSPSAGIAAFDDMVSKMAAVMTTNNSFYTLVGQADPDQGPQIFLPVKQTSPNPPVTNGCQDGCMDSCDLCLDTAYTAYSMAQVFEASQDFGPGWIAGQVVLAIAEYGYWCAVEGCVGSLNTCMSGC